MDDAILVFAGGRGTRLFGAQGGCKAATRIADEALLIDYALLETGPLAAGVTVLLSSEGCEELQGHFDRLLPSVDVVRAPAGGTAQAVVDLLTLAGGQISVVLPGDVVGDRGALTEFIRRADLIVRGAEEPLCVIASTDVAPDESDPGFVVSDFDGVVSELGKAAMPTSSAWVGVRLMNRAFAHQYVESWDGNRDDEQHMSTLAQRIPGSVRSLRCGSLFDVDDAQSLARARDLAATWRASA